MMSSKGPDWVVPTVTKSAATPLLMLNVPFAAPVVPLRTIFLLELGSSVKVPLCAAPPSWAGSVLLKEPVATNAFSTAVPLKTVVVTVVDAPTANTLSRSLR